MANSKEAGYDLIELPVFNPAAMDIAALQRALATHDLGVTCSLGLGFHNDINSEDPDSVARGEQTLNDALSAARDLARPTSAASSSAPSAHTRTCPRRRASQLP